MAKPCSVEECTTPSVAWSMCQKHYKRTKKYGSPHSFRWESNEDRFFEKVDKSGEHWMWLGTKSSQGHGSFHMLLNGRRGMHRAHRVSYIFANGDIPEDREIDHICRVRACVNPDHLRLATRKENGENLSPFREGTESGLRGVTRTSGGNWCARVGHNRQLIHIGVYDTMEEAAAAVVAKRLELHTYNHEDRIAA